MINSMFNLLALEIKGLTRKEKTMNMYFSLVSLCKIILILKTLFCCSFGKQYDVPKQPNWYNMGKDDIRQTLKKQEIIGQAKNVIVFIGDGMGYESVTAARIYAGQRINGQSGEEFSLSFENLPFSGTSKTYSVTDQIPESAATGTAIMTGRKVNGRTIGVSEKIKYNECSNEKEEAVQTLIEMAHAAGKSTGIVTTARITHATPAAGYAHTASRYWENDEELQYADNYGLPGFDCVDIARQLVEDHPYIKVLLGGGRRNLLPTNESDHEYSGNSGRRLDGRNLIEEWLYEKAQRNVSNRYVWNNEDFKAVNASDVEYLLGLFEQSHMRYEHYRQMASFPDPTLAEMTQKAIDVLKKDQNGFFLLVEGARIDHAHHDNEAGLALQEVVELDKAVTSALTGTDPKDTLVIVTADHAHSLATGGYPSRGNDILGTDNQDFKSPDEQGMERLTLAYHNGPGYQQGFFRKDHTGWDTTVPDYLHDSLYPTYTATHGLTDVPIFAGGPFAHLLNGVHEEHYIAHVIAYASCIGNENFHSYCVDSQKKKNRRGRKRKNKSIV